MGETMRAAASSAAGALQALVELFYRRYLSPSVGITASGPRVIVVVGAAASPGLPLWRDLARDIIDEAARGFSSRRLFLDTCRYRLSPSIGLLPKWQFVSESESERQLLEAVKVEALCGVALENPVIGERILNLLRRQLDPSSRRRERSSPPPQLGYELIAHMLKHGFIDHVITLNFDTLLDEAVKNELGSLDYERIIADHGWVTDVPDRPRLIKLHGSIDAPPTLRFTRSTTDELSQRMVALLDGTILGRDEDGSLADVSEGVHIVSVGYKWDDHDLATWVKSRRDFIEQIVVVRKTRECPIELQDVGDKVVILPTSELSPPPYHPEHDRLTTDNLMWAIWSLLEERMKQEAIPFMPAARHIVLGYLFGPQGESLDHGTPSPVNVHTVGNRFFTEVSLHLVKCKGMVNASVMAQDERIHAHYPRYNADQLERLSRGLLRRSTHPDDQDTYFAGAATSVHLYKDFQSHLQVGPVNVPRFDATNSVIVFEQSPGEDFLGQELRKIFEGPEVEVERATDPHTEWLFGNSRPLRTYVELQEATRRLLRDSPWSTLLAVAESGAWLFQPAMIDAIRQRAENHEGLTIFLLRAGGREESWTLQREIADEIERAQDELAKVAGVKMLIGTFSWRHHNRHLSLAVKGDGELADGIYFRRGNKMSKIRPVHVLGDVSSDAGELLLTFLSYVYSAVLEARLEKRGNNELLLDPAIDLLQKWMAKAPERKTERAVELLTALQGLRGAQGEVPTLGLPKGDRGSAHGAATLGTIVGDERDEVPER